MKFTPFKFQIPLAAGGIALMAFNYLQISAPHGEGLIKWSAISWPGLTIGQISVYYSLIFIMFSFSVINLGYIFLCLKELAQWLANKDEYQAFMNESQTKKIGIFVPIASLSMTASVIFAPVAFFVPQLSSNLQSMMLPGLIFFLILWFMLFRLEFRVLKDWLAHPLDLTQLNFVWMLDVFAFGLVSLTGTGIAAISTNKTIASIAAVACFFSLIFGLFLLVAKLAYLIYLQIKAQRLPDNAVLPAYFIVIPITCLFGFSFYRIATYLQTYLSLDVWVLPFVFLTFSYVVTVGWGAFCLYLLSRYFKRDFLKSDFSPSQWAMV
jgi:hypothetical protein